MDNLEEILAKYVTDYYSYFIDYAVNEDKEVTHLHFYDMEYGEFPLSEKIIEFISEFKQLRSFYIETDKCIIKDLSPLKDLYELKSIFIEFDTEVENLDFAKDLKGLERLVIGSSKISNIEVLADKKWLNRINLPNAQISDISVLSNLSELINIDFSNNKIRNIDCLKDCNRLKDVFLSKNRIKDIKPLENCKQLQHLGLNNNNISDIELLRDLEDLSHLSINDNQICDLSPIQHLKKISTLHIANNSISNIDFLKNFERLYDLNISNNEIVRLPSLMHTYLYKLDISKNSISDISELKNKGSLRFLNISKNPIESIEPLRHLTKLEILLASHLSRAKFNYYYFQSSLKILDLSYCNISNIGYLFYYLNSLTDVNLSHNKISSFYVSNVLPQLRYINLQYNKIEVIYSLQPFPKLETLDLRGNPLGNRYFQEDIYLGRYSIFQTTKVANKDIYPLSELLLIMAERVSNRQNVTRQSTEEYSSKVSTNSQNNYQKRRQEEDLEGCTYAIIFLSMLSVYFGLVIQIIYKTDSYLIATLFTIIFLPLTIYAFALLVEQMEKGKG